MNSFAKSVSTEAPFLPLFSNGFSKKKKEKNKKKMAEIF